MMDSTGELSRALGCKVVEISALKGNGIMEAAEAGKGIDPRKVGDGHAVMPL